MSEQLVFELPAKTGFGREDFFASPANALAVEAIENWLNWPLGKLVLIGPEGSGKSHLATIWAALTKAKIYRAISLPTNIPDCAICVEDIPEIAGNSAAETALFHLYNLAQETGIPLLMTGKGPVSGWGINLPDLASRLQGSNTVPLLAPDDALLSAVLVKRFADHQLRVEPGVIAYLLPRMERSFASLNKLVTLLDRQALQDKRPIGIKMARHVLETLESEAI